MITHHNIEQKSSEWFALRRGLVTGSNAHLLLAQGLKQAIAANDRKTFGTWHSKRGNDLEPYALEVYEAIYSKPLAVGFVTNDLYPNAGASPDGLTGTHLIEVKCFGHKKHDAIQTADQIPFEVMAQIQFNMMICERGLAHLVLYNPDTVPRDAFRVFEVELDARIVDNIKLKLQGEK